MLAQAGENIIRHPLAEAFSGFLVAGPAMLRAYQIESARLGSNPAHLESIGLLIERVDRYQREIEAKVPDTDLPCEIARRINGARLEEDPV
jgi:hypothetical protein